MQVPPISGVPESVLQQLPLLKQLCSTTEKRVQAFNIISKSTDELVKAIVLIIGNIFVGNVPFADQKQRRDALRRRHFMQQLLSAKSGLIGKRRLLCAQLDSTRILLRVFMQWS